MARTLLDTLVRLLLDVIDYELYEDADSEYAARIGYHGLLPREPRGYRELPDPGDETCAYADAADVVPLPCVERRLANTAYIIIAEGYEFVEAPVASLYDAFAPGGCIGACA